MSKRSGFTLVELLVVVAIIALLLGILVPALSGARHTALSVECASNMRQIHLMQTYYSDDNAGRFASVMNDANPQPWVELMVDYVPDANRSDPVHVFNCPMVDRSSFNAKGVTSTGVNPFMQLEHWSFRRDLVQHPARIILAGDKVASPLDYLLTYDSYAVDRDASGAYWWRAWNHEGGRMMRHANGSKANMAMIDGHVAALQHNDLVKDSGRWYWDALAVSEDRISPAPGYGPGSDSAGGAAPGAGPTGPDSGSDPPGCPGCPPFN